MTLRDAQDTHLTDVELHLPDMSLYQACLLLPGGKKKAASEVAEFPLPHPLPRISEAHIRPQFPRL